MDIKEKLVELLDTNCGYVDEVKAEVLADHLIANGVTVQEWIPAKEHLPQENEPEDTVFLRFPFWTLSACNGLALILRTGAGAFGQWRCVYRVV